MAHHPKDSAARLTHAGGIVYKIKNDHAVFLLVRPKKQPDEWVFPKGHIEPGERDVDAAVREVEEETGVAARVVAPVGTVEFDTDREHVRAVFFLMEFIRLGTAQERREMKWVPYAEALGMLTHESNRGLLRTAQDLFVKSRARD